MNKAIRKPHARGAFFARLGAALVLTALAGAGAHAQQISGTQPNQTIVIEGSQIPAPPPKFGGVINETADTSKPWWPPRIVPPKGAPNVLLIITDDVGFGAPSTFGGVIPTPALDRIANSGLRYTQFHSTALCSPTRAALITGRNHHSVGFGQVSETSTGFPGYDSVITSAEGTIGAILKDNGYSTAWFGKAHNTPTWEASQAGPFDRWPTGMGFEYFYGFVGGDTSQWQPNLFRNTTAIYPYLGNSGWNLTTAMADDAIRHINELNQIAPGKPFLIKYAPGGTHAPHHPTKEWIEKIEKMNLFDKGWNALREQIIANQKRLGLIPANTQLTAWPKDLPQWDSLGEVDKKLFIKQAEVYAAYLAYTDHEIGRVIQAVEDSGQLENTLIIYISGDNGSSAEGSPNGTPNEVATLNGVNLTPAEQLPWYPFWGSDQTYPHMAVPWTWAFDTPFKWTKQVASHFGGTRQGMAISWPKVIKDKGGIRTQFHHVIDVVPTILEAARIKAPKTVNGIPQKPIEGVSMIYTFDAKNAKAPSTRKTQYFEMFANRAIYSDGWVAATTPPAAPWLMGLAKMPGVMDYQWELYDIRNDFSQANDLAKQNPAKLAELQKLFMAEARKYQVLPLDNSVLPRLLAPRPNPMSGKSEFSYTFPVSGVPHGAAPDIIQRSYTITADITIPEGGGEGMIVTQGGRFGGWGLYLTTGVAGVGKGKPVFLYNLLNVKRTLWVGEELKPGRHTIVFEFKQDGNAFGAGGTGTLSVGGKVVDTKKVEHAIPFIFQWDETFDIGIDTGTSVAFVDHEYSLPFRLTAKLNKLTFNLGPKQMPAVAATPAPASAR
jgi:arylsulfatase